MNEPDTSPSPLSPLATLLDIQGRWAARFAPLDPDAMAALYSEDALFYGSTVALRSGRDGVRAYFAGLPAGVFGGVVFGDQQARALTPEVISTAGTASFKRTGAPDLVMRITLVLVRRDGTWLIASHHVSPKTA